MFADHTGDFHVLPQQRTSFALLGESFLVLSGLEFPHVLAQGGLVLHMIALLTRVQWKLSFLCS